MAHWIKEGRNYKCSECGAYVTESDRIEIFKYCPHCGKPMDVSIKQSVMDMWLCLPDDNVILHIEEGTGDNLLMEDRKGGYVDYVNYYAYDMTDPPEEINGGMIMYKELVKDKKDTDIIRDVINDIECHHEYRRFSG